MRVLIALVGEQPTPNLVPLFAALEKAPYNRVHFLPSDNPRIGEVAKNLGEALRQDKQMGGLAVEVSTRHIDAWDLTKARDDFADVIRQVKAKYPGAAITVNLTGGTKVMSLAAYQGAVEAGLPMLYVNTERNELIHFGPDGKPREREPLRVKICIETQLRAAGRKLEKCLDPSQLDPAQQQRAALAKWIVENYEGAFTNTIQRVKKRANAQRKDVKASGGSVSPAYPRQIVLEETDLTKNGKAALDEMANDGVWKWDGSTRTVTILNPDDWSFVNGGWVELYALTTLAESGRFDEVLGQVKVDEFVGELDVVVTKNGRLGIVECKASGPEEKTELSFVVTKTRLHEWLFGGPYASSFFARAAKEENVWKEITTQYGIKGLVAGADLTSLASTVATSMGV